MSSDLPIHLYPPALVFYTVDIAVTPGDAEREFSRDYP